MKKSSVLSYLRGKMNPLRYFALIVIVLTIVATSTVIWLDKVNNPTETAYMEGVFAPPWHNFVTAEYDKDSNSWVPKKEVFTLGIYGPSAVMFNKSQPACMWVLNYDGNYVVDLDSCIPIIEDGSESVQSDDNSITLIIEIRGQNCPNGEAPRQLYEYRPIDITQPMKYRVVTINKPDEEGWAKGKAEELQLIEGEYFLGNYTGYTRTGEPVVAYADEQRILYNATCHWEDTP